MAPRCPGPSGPGHSGGIHQRACVEGVFCELRVQGILRSWGPGSGERAETDCYAPAPYHPTPPHPYYYYYFFFFYFFFAL